MFKDLFKTKTETTTLDVAGVNYFRANFKALNRPTNPDYKDKSVGGIVNKYVDVNVPARVCSMPNSMDNTALAVVCHCKPIGYIKADDKKFVADKLKRITECTATISNGDCRIDDVKRTVNPDVSVTITYKA